ncbi:chitinase [Nemania serpens]|nr:chitinase [Nemania serpens]
MHKFFTILFCLLCSVQLATQQEPQCSTSKPCPEGCCSSAGWCGYGPDYCGRGCQGTCDRKSQCNPGWDSDQWSDITTCPLNVCCSKDGFCGTTEDFCGDEQVDRPSCGTDTAVSRVIGYFEAWAPSVRSCYSMLPENIPYGQYTHIIFSFAAINPSTFKVSAGDTQTEYLLGRMNAIKVLQPDIKIWVALGGWAFNDPGPTQTTFSDIAASPAHTKTFLDSLVQMMNTYGLDGVDIDWEYPAADDRAGRPEDFKNIVTFVKSIHERMKADKRGNSMAIPASYWYLQHFDIKKLESYVDWFNLMSYDMHGSWDIDNKFTGPYANSHTNMTEIQTALDLLWRNDIDPTKVTMGMGFYSRTFTLTDPSCNHVGCTVSSGGNVGRCSDTVGVLLHPEVAEIVSEKKLTPVLDHTAAVKTVAWGNQWTSFDDVATWRLKGNTARGQCIEGFMVWAMSQDDSKGTNIKALNSALGRKTPDFPDFDPDGPEALPATQEPLQCRWSSCFDGCPSGFKEVQRDGHEEIMLDTEICHALEVNGLSTQPFARLCCPVSQEMPTCTWRGHRNTGNCQPGCNDGEVEVGSLSTGCKKNHQSACCTINDATASYGLCSWGDCTSDPEHACGNSYVASSSQGWGGHHSCSSGQTRPLCCIKNAEDSFDFNNCKWVPKDGHLSGGGADNICEGACPQDAVKLALSIGFHLVPGRQTACYGYNAFCCTDPKPKVVPRTDDPGSTQGQEFKLLVSKYMESPSCPATILQPLIHDKYGTSVTKRGLDLRAPEYDVLQGRATVCYNDNWQKLLTYAVLMFTHSETGFDAIRSIWNNDFAGFFDEELEFAQLQDYFMDYPMIDHRAHLEYVLLNPTRAGEGMRVSRNAGTQLCHLPGATKKRHLTGSSPNSEDTKRMIWSFESDPSDTPNIRTILQGIDRGDLSLHYARWQWYNGGQDAEPGPFLELAYWIGPTPGVATGTAYDQFRDTGLRDAEDGTDRWAVIHMHFGRDPRNWLIGENGQIYAGTPGIRFFHGQAVAPAGELGGWRVDGDERVRPHTARQGWDCPEGEGLWYVGYPDTPTDSDILLLQRFGERLHREGYLNTEGLRLIIEPPTGPSGDINPENPGYLVRPPNGYTTAAGNNNPYRLNFLIENGLYQFVTQPPPNNK